jgi:uncharacterized membrane protein (DUF4010 family)
MDLPQGVQWWPDGAHALAAALGCGLLMGLERERRKGQGPGRALAGMRSFTLASLMGALSMLLGQIWLTVVGAAFIAALGVVAYRRDRSDDPGITTEIALLLAYLIGALCTWSLPLAAGLTVMVTGLLAAREPMHRFARDWLQPGELRDGLILCALALIAVPLLPDRALWGSALNPRTIATLLVLLLAIQALAHVARRLLQARHAQVLSSLAAGFVSSTATIATLGLEVREGRAPARAQAGAALLSCVGTMLQLLAVAAAVQPGWLAVFWLPALGGACVVAAWGWWRVRGGVAAHRVALAPQDARMFSLRNAGAVALLLTGIQAVVHGLSLWWGPAGLLAGVLLGALVDLHAAAAAVLVQGPPDAAALLPALMGALLVHNLSKCVTAGLSGGRSYLMAFAPGLLVHVAVVLGLLAWAGPAAAQVAPAATAAAPWPDTPATREFRQRVLDLAVLYGESSGLDPNGYLIETNDTGPAGPGCRRVLARISLGGVAVSADTFEVCKASKDKAP